MKTLLPYIFTLATITYGDTPSSVPPDTDEAAYPAIERFISVLESVRKNHPDADKLAYDRLVNRALEGMLSSLDPHSSFIHPEMRKAMESNEELDTHVASLGITISLRDAGFTITHLTRFGPADLQNIRTGTSILEIDGQNPSKSPIGKVLASLHKPAGSQTTLLLQTSLQPKPIAIVLTHLKVSDRAITQQHLLRAQQHRLHTSHAVHSSMR